MPARKLSARLAGMAGFVEPGETIADIGADHGYLPLHLLREGLSPYVVFTDVQPGPLEKTRLSLQKSGFDENDPRLRLRLGDGLQPLRNAEVDVVVIAGMGGETIAAILAHDPEKAIETLQKQGVRLIFFKKIL